MEEKKVDLKKKPKQNMKKPFPQRSKSEKTDKPNGSENFKKFDRSRNSSTKGNQKTFQSNDFHKNKQFEQKEFYNKNKFDNDEKEDFIPEKKTDFKQNFTPRKFDDHPKPDKEETPQKTEKAVLKDKKMFEKKKTEIIQTVKANPKPPNCKWYKPPPFPYDSLHFDPDRDLFAPLEETRQQQTHFYIDEECTKWPQSDKSVLSDLTNIANDLFWMQ